mgnify:CR=1 FL=1
MGNWHVIGAERRKIDFRIIQSLISNISRKPGWAVCVLVEYYPLNLLNLFFAFWKIALYTNIFCLFHTRNPPDLKDQ